MPRKLAASPPKELICFEECVMFCFDNKEFVSQFNRLTGSSLGLDRRSVIERMVDQACENQQPAIDKREAKRFIKFVLKYIWLPLAAEHFKAVAAAHEG